MNRNVFVIVTLFFLFANCVGLGFEPLDKNTDRKIKTTKNIGLLGFYPFVTKVSQERTGNMVYTTTWSELSFEDDLKNELGIGKPVKEYKVLKTKSISKENFLKLMDFYLKDTKRSGLQELENIIEFDKTASVMNLKYYNLDYYIFSTFLPASNSCDETLMSAAKGLLGILSIGLISTERECTVFSKYFIFDKNYKLIKEFSYHKTYLIKMGWFVSGKLPGMFASNSFNRYPPVPVIKYEMQRFKYDLIDFLNSK